MSGFSEQALELMGFLMLCDTCQHPLAEHHTRRGHAPGNKGGCFRRGRSDYSWQPIPSSSHAPCSCQRIFESSTPEPDHVGQVPYRPWIYDE